MREDINVGYDKKDKKEEVYRLWQSAFQDPEAFASYYFQWVYPENQVIAARKGTHLYSMLHLNPYWWHWEHKDPFLLHYIVGVATEETVRRQGLMAGCLDMALRELEAAQEPFTYLMPARQEYYLPFQFVPVHKEKCWKRNGDNWYWKDGREWKKGIPKGISEKKAPCFPLRSPVYRDRLKAETACEGGGLLEWGKEAYCAYVPVRREDGITIVIKQLFTEETDTLSVLEQRVCPALYQLYGNITIEYMESLNIMLRILHVSRFVELLSVQEKEARLAIQVTDPICQGNNGCFLLTLSKAGCSMVPLKESERSCSSMTCWRIEELTAYLLEMTDLGERMYLMEIV